jgi:ferredoxin
MDSPRGRIYLMKGLTEQKIGLTREVVGHFDACLGCMACVTSCPSGVQYAPLIEATRGQIERHYPRSLGDRLFRSAIFALFPYPHRLRVALAPVVVVGWVASAARAIRRIEMQRHIWIVLNMFQFVSLCLAVNKKRVVLPQKPNRFGLGRAGGINGGQPDEVFAFDIFLCVTSEFCVEIEHGYSPIV